MILVTDFETVCQAACTGIWLICVFQKGKHVYALCWLPPNHQLDVNIGIPLNFSIWYDRVPWKVLLYRSVTISSHVSCAFLLIPMGIVVWVSA